MAIRPVVRCLACGLMLMLLHGAALADPIRIGLANPLSGPLAASGERNRRAAELAVRTLNAQGGVLGREVRLVAVDDACGIETATSAALTLVKTGVSLVVGHLCSHSSLVAAAVYEAAMIPMISPDSTHPRLTEEGRPNVFRLGGRDDTQGRAGGDWLAGEARLARIAIAHDGTTYGRGLAMQVLARLEERGVRDVPLLTYPPGASAYNAVVDRLRRDGVELVYVAGYGPDAARVLRTARERGYALRMAGGDGLAAEEFRDAAGPAARGTVFTARPDVRDLASAAQVLQAFKALGLGAGTSGIGAYAAVEVWAEAVSRIGSLDPEALVDMLHRARFATVLGPVAFDAKGDLQGATWQWFEWGDTGYRPLGRPVVGDAGRLMDRRPAKP